MCKESSACLPIPVFVCVFSGVAAQSISTEHALKRYLFHNEFDPTSRPVGRNNDIVVVYLDLAIHQIVDLVSYCVSYIFFCFFSHSHHTDIQRAPVLQKRYADSERF